MVGTNAEWPANNQRYGVGARRVVRVRQDVGLRVGSRAVTETPESIREWARRHIRERHNQWPGSEGRCYAKAIGYAFDHQYPVAIPIGIGAGRGEIL